MRSRRHPLLHFNPLPSCEGRLLNGMFDSEGYKFQSTPLMRGETVLLLSVFWMAQFQSTPLMRGETPPQPMPPQPQNIFQSTPLMREETSDADDEGKFQFISIHSPHTRGDTRLAVQSHRWAISIHSPHTRGDSVKRTNLWLDKLISIHSPHTRGDDSRRSIKGLYPYFNPLPSYEGRHLCSIQH